MADQSFVHLHVHTEFSLLDGLSKIGKLVDYAKQQDMTSLAITDHGVMFGVIDFYRACKKAGVNPIIGMESYLAPRTMTDRDPKEDRKPFHLLLLAKNETGYKNLLKIASKAQLEGYYYNPRTDWDYLSQHAEGLIVTSGCLAAQIPQMLMKGEEQKARDLIDKYQQVFGKENFFLELQNHNIPELKPVNEWLMETGKKDDVRWVATCDVHYVTPQDYDPHDTLLCIQTGSLKSDTNRMSMSDNSYYLAGAEEMWKTFGHIDDGAPLKNTLLVAEMCQLDLDRKGYHLPVFPVPEGYESSTYLRYLCAKGLVWRFGERATESALLERLDRELTIIGSMGFETYFLIVWDLCEFARDADIWWNVRGSGAGSLAAYCLGITNIDPMQNNLLFERFLNPGRVSMPDIDIDYPDDRRGDMIAYTTRKYGEDKVAAIITFGTMGAKAAVRDVGRALGVPLELVNEAARLIPTEPKPKKVKQYVEDNPDLQKLYNNNSQIKQVIDTAAEVQGISRHASTHAAGIIVGDQPLVEYLPLHRQTKGEDDSIVLKQVTQFPMETCESIGLLKIDFLGLSTLTILRRACDLINKYRDTDYNMDNVPYRPANDPEENRMLVEAFEMIGRGETIGVFQVESTGMQQMLRGMRPTKFEHIVAGISLYRPGPMDYIPTYNDRMHGRQPVEYHHPKLEPILSETYGICVSGDTVVFDARTGRRFTVRELGQHRETLTIQAVDDQNRTVTAPVSHWIFNGHKPVYQVTLRSGAQIKTTIDHKFLTENGWQPLEALEVGSYVATPPQLVEPSEPYSIQREKLRVLAYLIGDGSLASGASVDFVSKDEVHIEEYVRCLSTFENLHVSYLTQIHDVTRVSVKNSTGKGVTSLLAWMRELGLKAPAGSKPGGSRSHEKFIPAFAFQLSNDDLAYFMASLWDCDGYMGYNLCHYKTISWQLAHDVQTLLLRLGIYSVIHQNEYTSVRGERQSYQVTVYDTARLAEYLQQHMVTVKRDVVCTGIARTTIDRDMFIQELDASVTMSRRELMKTYGIDRQHFMPNRTGRINRIATNVVRSIADTIPLPQTKRLTEIHWEEIVSIEPVGAEDVYDLTVPEVHNFVANNILVHNCVYQEQIMQIANNLFGYSLGDADLMRRAVSKKKKEDLHKHREIFMVQGPENGIGVEAAGKIFDDIEFFANYGFNKSHAADYGVITVQTAFLKRHFTEEYMTALLSVYFDDAAKVTTFLTECKRLDIPLLPPDVNYSEVDFDIQPQEDGRRGIRFGLAAVKNAGVNALEPIINARKEGGQFRDLIDFSTRIDLRTVGKRTLESLVKVGAFTSMGTRPQILNALDRMMSFSTDHHKAKDIGQASLFGGMSDSSSQTDDLLANLPPAPEATVREMLDWEKELLGLYISSHPIDPVMNSISQSGLSFTHDLKDTEISRATPNVSLVALVAGIRKMVTKNKDMMCILTLEDRYGSIDCVLFPRTWTKFENVIEEGKVLLFKGKLDISRGDPQIVCEEVTSEFTSVTSDDASLSAPARNDQRAWMDEEPAPARANGNGNGHHGPTNGNGTNGHSNGNGHSAPAPTMAEPPFAPDNFGPAASSEEPPLWLDDEGVVLLDTPPEEQGTPPRALHIQFHRSDDADQDARRLHKLYHLLIQEPGRDQFQFVVANTDGSDPLLFEFPNATTGITPRLLKQLGQIERIDFQEVTI